MLQASYWSTLWLKFQTTGLWKMHVLCNTGIPQCSGYHVRLTRARSPVRARAESVFCNTYELSVSSSTYHQWCIAHLHNKQLNKTLWRNGSASDSRSEGCVFNSRQGQDGFASTVQLNWMQEETCDKAPYTDAKTREVLPRFELGSLDSKSRVLTITPQNREHATRMGFEPTRAEPNGLAVHRLNHSATSSAQTRPASVWPTCRALKHVQSLL